jgi:rhamnosyltransferase
MEVVSAIKNQSFSATRVLVLDSSSADDTTELATRNGWQVVTIPRTQFSHGGTRQKALELAPDADVLVYLTQDSILADSNALAQLIAAFEDPSIGAAYGRQLPRRGAHHIEAHDRLFNYPPVSAIRSLASASEIGFKAIFFSNSFGAYRRVALEQVGGFSRDAEFGEDTLVAAHLLQGGWRILYAAEAQAYHSHAYSRRELFERYYKIGRLHGNDPWLQREFGRASGEGHKFVMSEIRYLLRHAPWLIPEAIIRTGVKYLGYKQGRKSIAQQPS